MGAWGPGLWSDDVACDVRDAYREAVEDGRSDEDATRQASLRSHRRRPMTTTMRCSGLRWRSHSTTSVGSLTMSGTRRWQQSTPAGT